LPGSALLRALNGIAPDIFFTAAVEVEEAFRVRAAIRRRYRYFEPASDRRAGVWAETAKRFHGSIDVRSFGRGISSVRPLLRRVESIDVRRRGKWLTVDVVAPAFVWGMVRKIISAFREVDSGRLDLSDLESALQGIRRLTLPLAEPEFLVLWEVEYPVEWKHKATRPSRNQQRYAKQAKDQAEVRSQILQRLWPGLLQE
jgi:tRNA pseudouridine38-40 synthase